MAWRLDSLWRTGILLGLFVPLLCAGCTPDDGDGAAPTVSTDPIVQALYETARADVPRLLARRGAGEDVSIDCRAARALYVADLRPIARAEVLSLLAELDRACLATPAPIPPGGPPPIPPGGPPRP